MESTIYYTYLTQW